MRDHHHLLRSEGLATDRASRHDARKGRTMIEVFEWASPAAIEEAHANPRVQAMWARFAACCDYVPLNTLAESAEPVRRIRARGNPLPADRSSPTGQRAE